MFSRENIEEKTRTSIQYSIPSVKHESENLFGGHFAAAEPGELTILEHRECYRISEGVCGTCETICKNN